MDNLKAGAALMLEQALRATAALITDLAAGHRWHEAVDVLTITAATLKGSIEGDQSMLERSAVAHRNHMERFADGR